jgi:hypothetical protein
LGLRIVRKNAIASRSRRSSINVNDMNGAAGSARGTGHLVRDGMVNGGVGRSGRTILSRHWVKFGFSFLLGPSFFDGGHQKTGKMTGPSQLFIAKPGEEKPTQTHKFDREKYTPICPVQSAIKQELFSHILGIRRSHSKPQGPQQ